MAKLPGAPDLGGLPAPDTARPTGTIDVSPLARAGAALAAGGDKLGDGLRQLGAGAESMAIDEGRWDYAKAHSDFLAKSIDIGERAKQDNVYGPDDSGKTMPERYSAEINEQRDRSAALITTGPMRERFQIETEPLVARGVKAVEERARGLDNDASRAYVLEQGDNLTNKAIAAPDDVTRGQIIRSHNQLVDGLVAKQAITQVQAFEMKRSWAKQYAMADVLARSDVDPQGVINELRAEPGTPADITNRILKVEGTGKNASSSAQGAGQFIDSTWLDVLKRSRPDLAQGRSDSDLLALRADKDLARSMTDTYRQENSAYLTKQGLEATPGAQYLAHFLGAGGAAAVLKADPNMPVADALANAKAVGPDKAKQMIDANPSILAGKLVGSVTQWADGKMGGAKPGSGSIYDVLRPDERETLLTHAQAVLDKQTVTSHAEFQQRVQDATSEAFNTGTVTKPVTLSDFVGVYGAKDGPTHFQQYDQQVQTGRAINAMATMAPADRQAVVESLAPKAGDANFSLKAKAYEIAQTAAKHIDDAMKLDPGGYAATKLPAARDAFQYFQNVSNGNDAARSQAAQKYASVTLLEQGRLGVPPELQRVVPQNYADRINGVLQKAADSDDPKMRVSLIDQVQREAAMWGDNWPKVLGQLAPNTQPIVRAIAAGADPTAMTRLLSVGKDENPAKILKEQNETKSKDLTTALNDTMAPFRQSLIGRQMDRDFPAYYGLAEKLGALYVRDGDSAGDAATKAFNALIGNRYEFRDTYRIPKSAGVSADDIQAGAQAARSLIGSGQVKSSFNDANDALNMTPQEQGMYQRHFSNLTGPGGVDNADGSRSTLFQVSFEKDGKTYNVPSVWDGKILKPDAAIKRAEQEGLDKFPSYGSQADAEARYGKMHGFMEQDTGRFLDMRTSNPIAASIKAAVADIPGLSDNRGDSLSKFARDGTWVTSHDNSGLQLVYGDKFVRKQDGTPFSLSWGQLAKLGGSPEVRKANIDRAILGSAQTP